MKKVVLAYSGGLDTSCLIKWYKDQGWDVIAYLADVGQGVDREEIEKRALATGASKVYIEDLRKEFIEDYVFPVIKAGCIYENKYLLCTALSRPIIAKRQMEIAEAEKADAIAHGCTGKGNDQVRFEVSWRLLNPNIEPLAPVRHWEFKTREQEIDYALKHNIPCEVTKKSPYSIDINVYGRAIECGVLEDPWNEPPEDIYEMTKDPTKCPDEPFYFEMKIKHGVPIQVNGENYEPYDIIEKLNEFAKEHGVGRVDMVENRLVGIKSREIYEQPAGEIIFQARESLEALVLDRETVRYKRELSSKYADLIYNGLWFTPQREQFDAYINQAMNDMSGVIRIKLYKGTCTVVGVKSKYSRYKEEMATYGDKDEFDPSLSEGFVRLWAMPFEK